MVVQYPDTAIIPGKANESVFQDDGTWLTSNDTEPINQIGRYEPSTLNAETTLADGSKVKLKGIFYMPVNAPDVDQGLDFQINNRLGDVVLITKVLFFTRGQLNSRVFL